MCNVVKKIVLKMTVLQLLGDLTNVQLDVSEYSGNANVTR